MEQDREWVARFTAAIGKRVEHYRTKNKMTVQAVADACAEEMGVPLDRSVIAKLEKGLRQGISVGELIAIAKAIGVPPILLVFPLGQEDSEEVEVLPGFMANTWEVVKWFTGEQSFPQQDENGRYYTMQPDHQAWEANAGAMNGYRFHEQFVTEWRNVSRRADFRREVAKTTTNPKEAEDNLQRAGEDDERIQQIEKELVRLRATMRRERIAPPNLPTGLAHLDHL